ncbi:MAG: hypothetical protein LN589_04955 [Rickettsia endosymbiont of Eriopis connexa]|nr:hypothetical protein [Rickettsia endosymbiont of Eriopis connexa]
MILNLSFERGLIDLKILQHENTSNCGVFVCDNLIRQAEGLEILTTEQCKGQGLNLRKAQAETLKQSLIVQQDQERHVYINLDSNISDDEDTNGNSNEVAPFLR